MLLKYSSVAAEIEADYKIIGYLPYWNYMPLSELELSRHTNINIAFCNPDENGRIYCTIPESKLKNIISEAHSNNVEVFAALGGGDGCDGYLQHLDTPEERSALNVNIMDYCESYDFDGIDLDIEIGSDHQIWNYYGNWCSELRTLCDERDTKMSTATAQWVAEKVTPDTFALFDFVNVMLMTTTRTSTHTLHMNTLSSALNTSIIKRSFPTKSLFLVFHSMVVATHRTVILTGTHICLLRI